MAVVAVKHYGEHVYMDPPATTKGTREEEATAAGAHDAAALDSIDAAAACSTGTCHEAPPPPLQLKDLPGAHELLRQPAPHQIRRLHQAAVAAGRDTYVDPGSGYCVFTSAALKKRPCCGNRCRHCPWGHKNVPKPGGQQQRRSGVSGGDSGIGSSGNGSNGAQRMANKAVLDW